MNPLRIHVYEEDNLSINMSEIPYSVLRDKDGTKTKFLSSKEKEKTMLLGKILQIPDSELPSANDMSTSRRHSGRYPKV